MKKHFIIIALLFICLIGITLSIKLIDTFDSSQKENSLQNQQKSDSDIITAKQLLKDVLENDTPSQFWTDNYISYDNYSNKKAFYAWKVTLFVSNFTIDDLDSIKFIKSKSNIKDCPIRISLKKGQTENNFSIYRCNKDGKYFWSLAYENSLEYLPDSPDVNYDGIINLKDYSDLKRIRETGKIPSHIRKNIKSRNKI